MPQVAQRKRKSKAENQADLMRGLRQLQKEGRRFSRVRDVADILNVTEARLRPSANPPAYAIIQRLVPTLGEDAQKAKAFRMVEAALRDGRQWRSKRAMAADFGVSREWFSYQKEPELWRLAWLACGKTAAEVAGMEAAHLVNLRTEALPRNAATDKTIKKTLSPLLAWLDEAPRITLDRAVLKVGWTCTNSNRLRMLDYCLQLGLIVVLYRDGQIGIDEYEGAADIGAARSKVDYVEWRLGNHGLPEKPNGWYAWISRQPWACEWSPGGPKRGRGGPIS